LRKKRKLLITGIVGIGLMAGVYIGQAVIVSNADGSVQPGSADDPLVTKSYLDEQLQKLTGGQWTGGGQTGGSGQTGGAGQGVSEARVQEIIAAELAKLKQELQGQTSGNGSTAVQPGKQAGSSDNLEVIKLGADQILYAGAGTELIVRTGKTIAVSNDDGIPDVTEGIDVPAGTAIKNNHLLVFPREGRGIKPDPNNKDEIYVMIRGGYILLNQEKAR